MNKKANIMDAPFSLKLIMLFVIMALMSLTIFHYSNEKFQSNSIVKDDVKTVMNDYNTNFQLGVDYGFIALLFGFIIFSVIQARRIQSSSTFYVFSIIVVVFVWLISILFSYFYVKFADNSIFTPILTNLNFIPYIMPNLLYYAILYTMIISIALYTKDN